MPTMAKLEKKMAAAKAAGDAERIAELERKIAKRARIEAREEEAARAGTSGGKPDAKRKKGNDGKV
eukprot:CAMPEP_0119487772 /NCGR_PEP_ID=MMETSP1344-20130328/13751_1 /TAXON_ID=236787 /ORGANISM="Florenciella parvula, Strain CCMP2471" /LENGTH=65 /DNA_ID=CAMNT_0007522653 /DNA_START=38 /DNA_END=232 /DNA_ORIENTATION=+